MKMYSPTGELVHMALTTGHSFTIGPGKDPVEVPARFARIAVIRGCLPEGAAPEKEETAPQPTKADLIAKGMKQMMDANDPLHFTGDGKPKVDALENIVGFAVTATERDEAWAQLNGDGDDD